MCALQTSKRGEEDRDVMQKHIPVLLEEAIDALNIKADGVYVDGTLGCAGHAQVILENLGLQGLLIGIDRDQDALKEARRVLVSYEGRVKYVHGNYSNILEILDGEGISKIDGILVDFGVSSLQLDEGERGFSFMKEARLDMRMDQSKGMCAEDVVNSLPEKELADVIYQFGEEGRSRKIARFIVKARRRKRIETTLELADVIQKAHGRRSKIHPATKTFQALRIYVNDELAHIDQFLEDSMTALKSEGRLCVMAYHSLEDRRVKQTFRTWAKEGKVALLTRKAILASREEIKRNKRSRSVRLRVCEALNKSSDLG